MSLQTNDRVGYSPAFIALYDEGHDVRGRVSQVSADGQLANVTWDDGRRSTGIHTSNLERDDMTPVVTSRALPGSPYREHSLTLGGVELRTQMEPFSAAEIAEAVRLYRAYGVRNPRHNNRTPWTVPSSARRSERVEERVL